MTIKLFGGYDPREAIGFATFVESVLHRSTKPVSIHALGARGGPVGSNAFTFSRFQVPALCGWKGHAIFADASDMIMLDDIAKLDALYDDRYAVQVVKHQDYESSHERKYVGTQMECEQSNYSRKNWASLMIFNCAHAAWHPDEFVHWKGIAQLQFQNLLDGEIGALPPRWNVLVDEGADRSDAAVLHWTAGLPSFKHYRNARRSQDWFREHDRISLANG